MRRQQSKGEPEASRAPTTLASLLSFQNQSRPRDSLDFETSNFVELPKLLAPATCDVTIDSRLAGEGQQRDACVWQSTVP